MATPIDISVRRDGLSTPWGFRLQGGVDYECPLTVQKVTPYSAVDGLLKKGDIILRVDDYDTSKVTHNVAMNLIANAGSAVKFTILRSGDSLKKIGAKQQVVRFLDKATWEKGPEEVTSSVKNDQPRLDLFEDVTAQAKLANVLKESLHGDTSKRPGRTHKELYQPMVQPWPNPRPDVTSYLPQMPPRRSHSFDASPTPRTAAGGVSVNPANTGFVGQQIASSGPSSPSTSSVIEFGSPDDPNRPIAIWTPPPHQPHSKLVHLQYNSPLQMYSADNVVDTVEKLTGSKLKWVKSPTATKYIDDIRDSPTYKFVQELEGRAPRPLERRLYEQSSTLKNMSRYFGLNGD